MKKRIINIVILIIIAGLAFNMLLKGYTINDLIMIRNNIKWIYIIFGIFALMFNWFFEALVMRIFAKSIDLDLGLAASMKYTLIGRFYSLITPFYAGGQPVQAFCIMNDGHSMSKTTSILVNKFMVHQIVLNFYSLTMIAINFNLMITSMKSSIPFVAIGLLLNIGIITVIGILFFNKRVFKKMIYKGIDIAYKLKFLKGTQSARKKALAYFADYDKSLKEMNNNKILFIKAGFITFLMMTCTYLITYCVYLAVGLREVSAFNIMSMQAILIMAIAFIPTPGTAGASEGGFYLLFRYYFGTELVAFAALVWRMIAFYINLLITGIVALCEYISRKRMKKANI